MNKKILIVSILAVLMLVAISVVSAVSSNTVKPVEKKRVLLFETRAARAIGKNLGTMMIDYIKTKFFSERIFFSLFPANGQNDISIRNQFALKIVTVSPTWCGGLCIETENTRTCYNCPLFERANDCTPTSPNVLTCILPKC